MEGLRVMMLLRSLDRWLREYLPTDWRAALRAAGLAGALAGALALLPIGWWLWYEWIAWIVRRECGC